MMPTDRRQRIGKLGEDAALAHLRRLGFGLVARRYRTRGGEIDLIVCDGETLVFVETKTRVARRSGIGLRANSVEWYSSRQQARQRAVAGQWLSDKSHRRPAVAGIRFDVIGVLVDMEGAIVDLLHLEGGE